MINDKSNSLDVEILTMSRSTYGKDEVPDVFSPLESKHL